MGEETLVTDAEKHVAKILDGWDLKRLEADRSALGGYEDRPRKTFSKGRKAPNVSWEELEADGTCEDS